MMQAFFNRHQILSSLAARLNASVRFLAPVILLSLLLVGSCRTSDVTMGNSALNPDLSQSLFPDRLIADDGGDYYPARGYVSRARDFVSHNAEALKKLSREEVSYVFGAPTAKRAEAPAEIWQYQTEQCVLDVYFYDDVPAAPAKVAHYDIRPRPQPKSSLRLMNFLREHKMDQDTKTSCLNDIAQGRTASND